MKLRQAKKIFNKEFDWEHRGNKASNRLVKAIRILKHFRNESYWPVHIYKDGTMLFILGG